MSGKKDMWDMMISIKLNSFDLDNVKINIPLVIACLFVLVNYIMQPNPQICKLIELMSMCPACKNCKTAYALRVFAQQKVHKIYLSICLTPDPPESLRGPP